MSIPRRIRRCAALASGVLLAACGGGGGGGGSSFDPAPALPQLSIANQSIAEGDAGSKTLTFTVTLSAASSATVTVDFAFENGTALRGSDFTATDGTLTFTPGQVSRPITVTVLGDTDVEPAETFIVNLSNATNANISDGQATGTITNDDASAQFGLDARPVNTSCIAPPRPTGGDGVETTPASGFSFTEPTKILQAPGDASRWFVLEKGGRVRVFPVANPANVTTYLDFSSVVDTRVEGGLLGMAFHPDFPATPQVFLSYTVPGPGTPTMISRVTRLILNNTTAPTSYTEQVLLTVNQPQTNHNGGDIAFGPDGYLYIGLGDGGGAGDTANNAQNTTNLLGAMLRINVLGVTYPDPGYTIPPDNPFAGNAKCGPGSNADDCPEIWAWGLRNPWRWSFDRDTGRLWLGDVGQSDWEEVNIIERGKNYGWRCREGAHPYNTAGCPGSGLTEPVAEYAHDGTSYSVTGGDVYRGNAIPELQGKYVFGDFGSGVLWTLTDNGNGSFTRDFLFLEGHLISDFALGEDGELYLADYGQGVIRKLVPKAGGTPDTIPDDLADTGCVNPADPTQPASGLIPYGIEAPFWSDGAAKERWLALPENETITVNGTSGDWELPPGSVIMKLFRLNGAPIETRLLMRHPDGEWRGYTWEWSGGVATRLKNGKTTSIGGQDWTYPSESQCLRCHTAAAGFSLGLETAQLNGNGFYPATGRTANQLATLSHIGVFDAPLPDPATLPVLPDPADAGQPLAARARAWLHTNCAQCHRPGGPTPSTMDLRYTTPLANMGACNVAPSSGDLGLVNPRLVKPGDAANSVIPVRMGRRDGFGMPPLASAIPDDDGVTLVSAWISSLSGCN